MRKPTISFFVLRGGSQVCIGLLLSSLFVTVALCAPRTLQQESLNNSESAKNEASAIQSLREINEAEALFATTYMRGFTSKLKMLGGRTASQPNYSAAGLIDEELANGQKNGYTFTYFTEVSDGRPSTYRVSANPDAGAAHGDSYFTDQSGVIRVSRTGPATAKDPPLAVQTVKLDPVLSKIVPADSRMKVLGDFGVEHGALTEGPVWVRKGGYLLFSEVAGNVIYKWTPDGKITVFLKPSGYTGTGPAASKTTHNGRALVHLIGSVGLTLDPQGRVVFCAQGDRAIVRLEKDGKRTVLVDRFEGKRLNSTNDLVYKSNGTLYFTDPNSGLQRGDSDPLKELPFEAIFMLRDGKVTRLDFHGRPNGLALSPDEKYFYAIDSTKNTILRFEILPDDSIARGELFVDMSADHLTPDGRDRGGPDGMKVDVEGNVYSSGPDGVWVISPKETLIKCSLSTASIDKVRPA